MAVLSINKIKNGRKTGKAPQNRCLPTALWGRGWGCVPMTLWYLTVCEKNKALIIVNACDRIFILEKGWLHLYNKYITKQAEGGDML